MRNFISEVVCTCPSIPSFPFTFVSLYSPNPGKDGSRARQHGVQGWRRRHLPAARPSDHHRGPGRASGSSGSPCSKPAIPHRAEDAHPRISPASPSGAKTAGFSWLQGEQGPERSPGSCVRDRDRLGWESITAPWEVRSCLQPQGNECLAEFDHGVPGGDPAGSAD